LERKKERNKEINKTFLKIKKVDSIAYYITKWKRETRGGIPCQVVLRIDERKYALGVENGPKSTKLGPTTNPHRLQEFLSLPDLQFFCFFFRSFTCPTYKKAIRIQTLQGCAFVAFIALSSASTVEVIAATLMLGSLWVGSW
jgi:hypothetical protein